MVVGVLTWYALLHSVCVIWKQYMKYNLIWEVAFYECKLDHNAAVETTKNICCVKGEGSVDHNNQMVQKILLGLQEPQQSGKVRPKNIDSEAVFYVKKANSKSIKLGISQSRMIYHLHNIGKSNQNCQIVPHVTKIFQNFWPILVCCIDQVLAWKHGPAD